jgi:hypothetical protein
LWFTAPEKLITKFASRHFTKQNDETRATMTPGVQGDYDLETVS